MGTPAWMKSKSLLGYSKLHTQAFGQAVHATFQGWRMVIARPDEEMIGQIVFDTDSRIHFTQFLVKRTDVIIFSRLIPKGVV